MRRILVDHARKRRAAKRDGGVQITLDDAVATAAARNLDILALDGALDELQKLDPRAARVVEMRFFGGLSIDEAAYAIGISSATVEREWATARACASRRASASAKSAASPAQARSSPARRPPAGSSIAFATSSLTRA